MGTLSGYWQFLSQIFLSIKLSLIIINRQDLISILSDTLIASKGHC